MPGLKLNDPKKATEFFQDRMDFTLGPVELNRWLEAKEKVQVIDVRQRDAYDEGHIPGAVSLPKDQWAKPNGLAKDRVNVFYCYSQVCHLAPAAALHFARQGYSVMELEGGFDAWEKYQMAVEKGAAAASR